MKFFLTTGFFNSLPWTCGKLKESTWIFCGILPREIVKSFTRETTLLPASPGAGRLAYYSASKGTEFILKGGSSGGAACFLYADASEAFAFVTETCRAGYSCDIGGSAVSIR